MFETTHRISEHFRQQFREITLKRTPDKKTLRINEHVFISEQQNVWYFKRTLPRDGWKKTNKNHDFHSLSKHF